MKELTADQAKVIAKAKRQKPHNLDYKPSYPIDWFLWLDTDQINHLVSNIELEAEQKNKGRRQRDNDTKEKFTFSIKIIILNLLLLRKFPLKTFLAVSKAAGSYSHRNRYNHPLLSFRAFTPAYNSLLELGYIRIDSNGYYDHAKKRGKVTRIDATHKLNVMLDELFPSDVVIFARHPLEETIRLKDEEKDLIDYKESTLSIEARDSLRVINNCLNQNWYDIDLTDKEFDNLHKDMVDRHKKKPKSPPVINFASRSLYRVYNNGDNETVEENFKQGGRFFGGWWESLISDYRKFITINGKPTVELDYSALHPYMLYSIEGVQLESDPYEIKGVKRNFGKIAFQQLINGKGKVRRPDDFIPKAEGMSWKDTLNILREYHNPISRYFDSGYGIHLQNKDAEIIENILLHYAASNTPCLPVHDSIIIHHDLKDEVKEVMLIEYRKAFGYEAKVKQGDNGYNLFVEKYNHKDINADSVEEIILEMQGSQYERRLLSWYKHIDN